MQIQVAEKTPRDVVDFVEKPALNADQVQYVAELFDTPLTGAYNWDYSAQDNPLYELIEGEGEKQQVKPLFSIAEILESIKEVGQRGLEIKRFKGLGSLTNPPRRHLRLHTTQEWDDVDAVNLRHVDFQRCQRGPWDRNGFAVVGQQL